METFEGFMARIGPDPAVTGVVLSGSQAREGTATAHSDHDVYLIVAEGAAHEPRRDELVDAVIMTLEQFRGHALPGSGTEWNRYAFAYAKVLKDTADGLIASLVTAKATLTPGEADVVGREALGVFLNSAYRCLKNGRDGNRVGVLLDGAETVPSYLAYVFALHGRVRPYNKYLEWELRHHPLGPALWSAEKLLPRLEAALSAEAPAAVRVLLNDLEPYARAAGHGDVLDSWGEDLAFMRGA
ncbi:hypothetical protein ACBJ59_45010 [Nonomuraea sp. MTCD27]|uniref:hypothetical protein n=1 Tax=Nonomuraea sp. MTCD27 TaxID=1676747 RepID=UPI0035C1277B